MTDRFDLSPPKLDDSTHPAYTFARPEIIDAVPAGCRRVLDVGCSTGAIGAALRRRGHHVVGVEVDRDLADQASAVLDEVVVADVEILAASDDELGPVDCVVLADVLEHLRNPWAVVAWAARQLDRGGVVVVSVPNIRHIETLWQVFVRGWWPYRPIGIFDRTHLRFFARRNLPELFEGTGLVIRELRRQPMVSLDPSSRWNRIAPLLGDLGTLQFVVVAGR